MDSLTTTTTTTTTVVTSPSLRRATAAEIVVAAAAEETTTGERSSVEQRRPRQSRINDQQQQQEQQRQRIVITQLSLDVSDKTKSVNLLRNALADANVEAEASAKETEDGLRLEYGRQIQRNKAEQAAKLEACDRLIERKKEWTEVLGKLLEKKREATEYTIKSLKQIEERKSAELVKARKEWQEEESVRRKKWMDRKVKEIRQITIKGLEPQVKRLLGKHKRDVADAKRSAEARKHSVEIEQETHYGRELTELLSRTEKKRLLAETESRSTLERKISDAYLKHSSNVADLRDTLSKESNLYRTKRTAENRRALERHKADMTAVRKSREDRLSETRNAWTKEKETIQSKVREDYESFARLVGEENKCWENERVDEFEQKRLLNVEHERKNMMRMRDAKIDEIIRSTQAELLDTQEETRKRIKEETLKLKLFHQKRMKEVRGKIDQWKAKTSKIHRDMKSLEKENDEWNVRKKNIEDSKKAADMDLSRIQDEFLRSKTLEENELKKKRERAQIEVELCAGKTTKIEKEMIMQRNVLKRLHDNQEEKISSMKLNHQHMLENIEKQVKSKMTTLENSLANVLNEINEQQYCLDHMRKQAQNYESSSLENLEMNVIK